MTKSDKVLVQTLLAIQKLTIENGFAPTYKELATELELESTNTVFWRVQSLEEKGWIKRRFSRPGMIITPEGREQLAQI